MSLVKMFGRGIDAIRKALFDRKQSGANAYQNSLKAAWYTGQHDWKTRLVRVVSGVTVRGPAFLPADDWSGSSRQVRRAALRTLNFARVTKDYPLEPRKARRLIARAWTVRQYREAQVGMQP